MTVKEFLAKIDPVESNWKTLSPGHWQNTATGAKYDTTDIVQAQIDAYNLAQHNAGKPPFIPGITPVPHEIEVTPGGTGNKPTPNQPGPTTGGPLPAGSGGPVPGGPTPGVQQGPNYIPGSTWNQGGPGAAGAPPPGAAGFGAPMQWNEQAGSGTGGPQHTGMAMPFSPYGSQQQLSSEILRYGGKPNSGKGGYWSGINTPTMQAMFAPKTNAPGSAAGPLDPMPPPNAFHPIPPKGSTPTKPANGFIKPAIDPKTGKWDYQAALAEMLRNGGFTGMSPELLAQINGMKGG